MVTEYLAKHKLQILSTKQILFLYHSIVKKQEETGLDFIIDKLTNSIENIQSGDSLHTDKKEPLDVDFEVDSRPLTKEEQLKISEFIKADKAKRALLEKQPTKTRTSDRTKTTA